MAGVTVPSWSEPAADIPRRGPRVSLRGRKILRDCHWQPLHPSHHDASRERWCPRECSAGRRGPGASHLASLCRWTRADAGATPDTRRQGAEQASVASAACNLNVSRSPAPPVDFKFVFSAGSELQAASTIARPGGQLVLTRRGSLTGPAAMHVHFNCIGTFSSARSGMASKAALPTGAGVRLKCCSHLSQDAEEDLSVVRSKN